MGYEDLSVIDPTGGETANATTDLTDVSCRLHAWSLAPRPPAPWHQQQRRRQLASAAARPPLGTARCVAR
jgi:hypothetical protein